MASNGIPASNVSSSTADFDILYERVTVRAVQTLSCTCNRAESEYPEYVAEELALFYKLRSELRKKRDEVPLPTEVSKDLEFHVRDEDVPKNLPIPDEDSDPMDCEVLWIGTANASDPEPKPTVQELDVNGNLEAAVNQNEEKKDLSLVSIPMEEPEPDSVTNILLLPKKSESSETLNKAKGEQGEVAAFQCQICAFSLSSRDDLRDHLANHAKISQKQADIYEQSRTLLEVLNQHEKSGKKKKQNQCRYCEKSFSTRTDFREHMMKLHSGDRPWTCSSCPKNYTRRNHLQRHEATKHFGTIDDTIGSYRCSECTKRYTCREYLKAHQSWKHSNRT